MNQNILIVCAYKYLSFSGIFYILEQLAHFFSAKNIATHIIVPEISKNIAGNQKIVVNYWPEDKFTRVGKEDFLFTLEKYIVEHNIKHVIAFDIEETGFITALATHLRGISFSAFLTYRDAFSTLLRSPKKFEATLQQAKVLFTANPSVFRAIQNTSQNFTKCYYLDLPCFNRSLDLSKGESEPQYILTTGVLDCFVDYNDLFQRVIHSFNKFPVEFWLHAGTIDDEIYNTFNLQLKWYGLHNRFKTQGFSKEDDYKQLVTNCSVFLMSKGGQNTGISNSHSTDFSEFSETFETVPTQKISLEELVAKHLEL